MARSSAPLTRIMTGVLLALLVAAPSLGTTTLADDRSTDPSDTEPAPPLALTAADPCATNAPPAWFLGVVHDDARRNDFLLDIDNFEWFLDRLDDIYCIPDDHSEILAMSGGYTRNGNTYARASVPNVADRIQDFGNDAEDEPDATFFFFLSSHGLVYGSHNCPGNGLRVGGSFSALSGSNLYDCDLGTFLTAYMPARVKQAVVVDCSFCGGFSDSLTAVSGTIPDNEAPKSSRVPGDNRIVITGCAMTTECFGGPDGGQMYGLLRSTWAYDAELVSRWTAPGFPTVQGIDAPAPILTATPTATLSELFFNTVYRTYATSGDPIAMQQQYRIKYGFDSLDDDIRVI